MGLINDQDRYIPDVSISLNDFVIGSDGDDLKRTKTYMVSDLVSFIGTQLGLIPIEKPYLIYEANFTQSGTSDPTVDVLQNELGFELVWTRSGLGQYNGTFVGGFSGKKVSSYVGGNRVFPDSTVRAFRVSSNVLRVSCNYQELAADSILSNTSIEFRIYPE